MKLLSSGTMLLVVTALAGTVPASAQSPAGARSPVAYLGGALSFAPIEQNIVAARGSLEIPAGRTVRPWIAAGVWSVQGYRCIPESLGTCNPDGTSLEAGVDGLMANRSSIVVPFVGAGAAWHAQQDGPTQLSPLVRLGADLQLSRWLAPRVQMEWSTYPGEDAVVLLTAGLRVGLPGPSHSLH